ncbi:MAG: hypothetical protein WCA20_18505, partial [Candidatus Sulfotelmatobacter sp.]
GESYEEFLGGLAKASGIETPSREDLARLDRKRKKRMSNKEWESPADGDARITKMREGRTHLGAQRRARGRSGYGCGGGGDAAWSRQLLRTRTTLLDPLSLSHELEEPRERTVRSTGCFYWVPVPDSGMPWGLEGALSLMPSLPVAGPTARGVKAMLTLQE